VQSRGVENPSKIDDCAHFVPTLYQNRGTLGSNPAQSVDPWPRHKSHLNLPVFGYIVSPVCANPPPASLSTCARRIRPAPHARTGAQDGRLQTWRILVIQVLFCRSADPGVLKVHFKDFGKGRGEAATARTRGRISQHHGCPSATNQEPQGNHRRIPGRLSAAQPTQLSMLDLLSIVRSTTPQAPTWAGSEPQALPAI